MIQPVFGSLSDHKGPLTLQHIEELQNVAFLSCSENIDDVRSSESFSVRQRLPKRPIEWQKEMQSILPSTSDVHEMAKLKRELGYSGCLSAQYAEDLQLLPLTDEQKYWLVIHYGPTSDKYMAISREASKSRRNFLLYLVYESKQSSHRSISSVGSHKK